MWKCEHCGGLFEEANRVLDPEVGYLNCCPYCGFDDICSVFECSVCGEYTDDTTHGACQECYEKLKEKVVRFLNGFDKDEYEVVMGIIDEL